MQLPEMFLHTQVSFYLRIMNFIYLVNCVKSHVGHFHIHPVSEFLDCENYGMMLV